MTCNKAVERIARSFDLAPDRSNRDSERTRSIASFHWRQRAGIFAVMTKETAGMLVLELPT